MLNCLSQLHFVFIFFFPFVFLLNVHHLSFGIAAMNWPFVNVQRLQVLNNNVGNAIDKSNFSYILQIRQLQFQRIHKLGQVHGILALLVQKQIQIERFVVVGIKRIVLLHGSGIATGFAQIHNLVRQVAILLHHIHHQIRQNMNFVDRFVDNQTFLGMFPKPGSITVRSMTLVTGNMVFANRRKATVVGRQGDILVMAHGQQMFVVVVFLGSMIVTYLTMQIRPMRMIHANGCHLSAYSYSTKRFFF